jgi:molybdopterin molybdotransferase
MGKFEAITEMIKTFQPDFGIEEVELKDAMNRVLQEDVFADIDMPPFNKSAMDGFACHPEDLQNELEILETLQAGMIPGKIPAKNQCVKIMTGAPIPDGCEVVFKVEDSEITRNGFVRFTGEKTNLNICYKGEDYKSGDLLIRKGTLINVPRMAVLAGAGKSRVKVTVTPKIAVIATGSELVEPWEKPANGKIRNSNASQLISQLRKMNIEPKYQGLAKDDFETLDSLFKATLEKNDIVFFTGGASFGDFDLIPGLLEKNGFKVYWSTTGIKPGNPMSFSQKGNKYCFGLSGNPVSSLVQFEFIAKPVIYRLMGAGYNPLRIKTVLADNYRQKVTDRLIVIPVFYNQEGFAEVVPFHGSAHINALVQADALMEIEPGTSEIKKGELVYVRPL